MKRLGWSLTIGSLVVEILLFTGCRQPVSNIPPVSRFSAVMLHGYKYAPLTVLFDASSSIDPDGHIVSYAWNLGDGQTGNSLTLSHTYARFGTYTVTLRVQDNRSAEDAATDKVVVLAIPEGQLLRRYEWTYAGSPQYLEFLLPKSLYQRYHDQVRQPFVGNYDYDDYVLDPLDEPTLEDLAKALWDRTKGGYEPFLECALAFVQSAISYTPDPAGVEYPLYPLETLVDAEGGDCEDTTILFVSLVRARGYNVSMAHVDTDNDNSPDHLLALVPISQSYADAIICPPGTTKGVFTIDGQLYAIAETRGSVLPLGCDPWGLEESDFEKIWDL